MSRIIDTLKLLGVIAIVAIGLAVTAAMLYAAR